MATYTQAVKEIFAHSAKVAPFIGEPVTDGKLVHIKARFVRKWGFSNAKTQSQAIKELTGAVKERKVIKVFSLLTLDNDLTDYVLVQYQGGDFAPYVCGYTAVESFALLPLENCA